MSRLSSCCLFSQRKRSDFPINSLFVLLLLAYTAFTQQISFKSHQVLRLKPENDFHFIALKNLSQKLEEFDNDSEVAPLDFWSGFAEGNEVDVRVAPSHLQRVKRELNEYRIPYRTFIPDLQSLIEEERQRLYLSTDLEEKSQTHNIVGRYARYDEILSWMRETCAAHSEICSFIFLGKSSEQRPLAILKLGKPRTDGQPKTGIWIDAGIHAREWIAPATLIYVISKLLEEWRNGLARTKRLIDNFDWFLLPVANPDGYEYTWTHNRLWRKTRSKTVFSNCRGADPNRNWGFHWRESGASSNPCDDTYAGSLPFSEPETRLMSEFILKNQNVFKIYLSLHSYSQMFLTPWGYTYDVPNDYDELISVAEKAIAAIKTVRHTVYQTGSSTRILYSASGGSDDWVKGIAGVKYAYTVELPDRGNYGFLLPSTEIVPVGAETFVGIKALAEEVASRERVISSGSLTIPTPLGRWLLRTEHRARLEG